MSEQALAVHSIPAAVPTRLARALAATLRRNRERPSIHYETFEASRIPADVRAGFGFLVVNMWYIEAHSTPNLASLAACAPVPLVSACFTAQIDDEIAHGAMLKRWLSLYAERSSPHIATRIGVAAAALSQKNAWLGIANAEILTEHYASALLDELIPRVDEPCLRAILEHIQSDEARHKVIAIESVRLLREHGCDRTMVARLFGPAVTRGTVAFFRRVFGRYLERDCGALALPHARILERALDEVSDALADKNACAGGAA